MPCKTGFGLLAFLLYTPAAGSDVCDQTTGGGCTLFPCHESRGPTVCTVVSTSMFGMEEKACLCEEGYCSDNGVCIPKSEWTMKNEPTTTGIPTTTIKTTTTFDCEKAYDEGCYKENPFKGCCNEGECKDAHEVSRCHWGYQMPCCPDLFNESFEWTDRSADDDCHLACNALGDKSNSYMDYCPGGSLESLPWFSKCPAAKSSLEKIRNGDWCSTKNELVCKWSFTIYNKITDDKITIQDSFAYSETNNSDCIHACAALGDPSNSDVDFCNKPSLTSRIEKCTEAKRSYEKVHPKWCSGGGKTPAKSQGLRAISSVMLNSKQELIAARTLNRANSSTMPVKLGAEKIRPICHMAYASECMARQPFLSCCSHCSSGAATHQCFWQRQFKGMTTGNVKLSAVGDESWDGCDAACDTFGSRAKDPMWLCDKQEVEKVFDTCQQARATFPTIPWCSADVSLSATTEPALGLDPAVAAGGAILLLVTAIAVGVKLRSQPRPVGVDYQPMLG